jgi:hypothetical protein
VYTLLYNPGGLVKPLKCSSICVDALYAQTYAPTVSEEQHLDFGTILTAVRLFFRELKILLLMSTVSDDEKEHCREPWTDHDNLYSITVTNKPSF